MSKVLKVAAVVVAVAAITVATAGIGTAAVAPVAVSGAATGFGVVGAGTIGVAATVGSASLFGLSAGTLMLASSALSLASSLTAKKPTIAATGTQTQFNADPNAGIPYLMGRTGEGGFIVFRSNADGWSDKTPNDLDDFVIVHSLGPIQGYERFSADQVTVTFDAAGGHDGYMWQKSQLGACPEPAALAVAAGASARPNGWGTDAKLSGLAASIWRLRFDSKGNHFQTGTPKPQWVVLGVKVYDPRLDSSYPGGSGTCRSNDESTWVYSENPYLHGLTWLIGRHQNGQRVMGVGMPMNGIVVSSFVEGANVADANGWKVGGVVYSTDNKWEVLKAILQAGGGEPLRLGAQIGCLVNTPRVSLATIGINDLAQGEVSVQVTQPQRARINGVIPRYRSEDHNWTIVPGAPVRVPLHVAEDGGQRTREIEYPLVQVAQGAPVVQPAQLARYDIENAREFGPISIPLKLRWMGYRPGDCVTANLPESGLNNQPILLLNRGLEPGSGTVSITARSETAAKHPFALGQTTTPPPTPGVTGPPLVPTPASGDWLITGTSVSANGVTVPALRISGIAPSSIEQVVFEYRVYTGAGMGVDEGWIGTGIDSPSITEKRISGVASATQYQVSVSYRARSATGGRLILGPVTTAPWAGIEGDSPPLVRLNASQQVAKYNAANTYVGGPITFNALRQNTNTIVAFAIYRVSDNALLAVETSAGLAAGTPTYFATSGSDNLTMTAVGVRDYINAHGAFRVRAYLNDGSGIDDTISIQKVKDGADGAPGLNGADGLPGAPGASGQTSYVHFAYADSADGSVNFTTGAAGGRYYVGVYTDFTPADSANPAAYTWSVQRGADGANGTPGPPGANGEATYIHIAYANSSNGVTGFSTTDGVGKTYIGTYTDQTLADSNDPALYTWSLIKGDIGPQGPSGGYPAVGISAGTVTYPTRISLNDNQAVSVEARYRTAADTGVGTAEMQVQIRPAGGAWIVMTNGTITRNIGVGEPVTLTLLAATYVNTSGEARSYEVRVVVENAAGGSEYADQCFMRPS